MLLMAFLQRVLNGGGHIDRDYGAGRGRVDLYVEFNGFRHIIEIKMVHWYQTPEAVRKTGLKQIIKNRDRFSPDIPAYLVIFDRCPEIRQKSWDERITWERESDIIVLGC